MEHEGEDQGALQASDDGRGDAAKKFGFVRAFGFEEDLRDRVIE